jgi:hypothetical protein
MLDTEEKSRIRIRNNMLRILNIGEKKKEVCCEKMEKHNYTRDY